MKNRASLISGTPLAIQGNGPWRTRLMLVVGFLTIAVSSGCGVDPQNTGQQLNVAQQGATIASVLFDHPDGAEVPPPYGLRLDGVEWAVLEALSFDNSEVDDSATWTFSFEQGPASMTGIFDEGTDTFQILGTAYGGLDVGQAAGPGAIAIDFTYFGVTAAELSGGLFAGFGSGSGTIEFLDSNTAIAVGTVVLLQSFANGDGLLFQFDDDNHRLNCPGDQGCDSPVGAGWLQITGARESREDDSFLLNPPHRVNSQDWLFTTRVPEF